MLLVAALFENVRYKMLKPAPPAGAQATAERFVDPQTGKLVQVYFYPTSGERTYVEV